MITEKLSNVFSQCKECGHGFSDGLLSIKIKSKWGFVNSLGELVIPCVYDSVKDFDYCFHDGWAIVVKNKKYAIIDKQQTCILPFEYDSIAFFCGCYILNKEGEYSVAINNSGKIVTAAYREAYVDSISGLVKVVTADKKYGLIKKDGTVIYDPSFDFIGKAHEDVVCAKKGSILQCRNFDGEVLFSIDTEAEGPNRALQFPFFSDNVAIVRFGGKYDNKYGLVDINGKIIVAPEYEELEFLEGTYYGCIAAKINQKYGLIDTAGNPLTEFMFDNITPLMNGFCEVRVGQKYGVIDSRGKIVYDAEFDLIRVDKKDSSYAQLVKLFPNPEGKEYSYGGIIMYESALIVDESMKEVGKISARKITESRYKLFVVKNDEEKYGLCDVEGKMLIPFTCKNIFIKTPSLIGVSLTSRYAFCDIYGKPLTEYIYGNASSTIDTEHYFIISDNYSNYGVMSADGQIVTECKFEKIGAFAEGLAVAKSHKACYLIDLYGESEPIGNAVLQG